MTGDADLAAVGALLAEPARARILLALGDGRSLPASVLAAEAGVAPSTASHHLARLVDGGLLAVTNGGRHRYFALAGPRVADLLEATARVAPPRPVTSLREGTRAHALRYARSCYDHLAGRLGLAVTDALLESGAIAQDDGAFTITTAGARRLARLSVDASAGQTTRACLDWTEQRPHVAGPVGRALLARFVSAGWLVRDSRTRVLRLTDDGRRELPRTLGLRLP